MSLQSITAYLAEQIPHRPDCAGCPYLDIDYCNLMEQTVDCKICGINDDTVIIDIDTSQIHLVSIEDYDDNSADSNI